MYCHSSDDYYISQNPTKGSKEKIKRPQINGLDPFFQTALMQCASLCKQSQPEKQRQISSQFVVTIAGFKFSYSVLLIQG